MLNKLIALGLILGLIVGLLASATQIEFFQFIAQKSEILGKLFINAIRMVVIPLVVTVIFVSVARLGNPKELGAIGGRTVAFYLVTLIPAILIGIGVMSFGRRFISDAQMPDVDAAAIPELQSISDFIISLVPANPFAAAANGALLPLIVFTVLFAAATAGLNADRKARMVQGAEDIQAAMIKLVWWVLYSAPIGVFGLIAPATARLGWGLLQSLGVFILCVLVGLLIFVSLIYLPALMWRAKIGPVHFFKSTLGAASVAFSTTSTVTAIPVSLEESKHKLGISENIVDLVIPLGASMYRPGSALFQGAAIIFLAHIYGVPIAAGTVGAIVLATFLVSLTVAPVPSSSVVTMAPALETIGVPIGGLALILGVDRIPDMMRSAVNVWGQITTAVMVDGR